MKLLLCSLFLMTAYSQDRMSDQQQADRIEKISKNIRRSFWVNGYEEVFSTSIKMSESELDQYLLKDLSNEEDPLSAENVIKVKDCQQSSHCELYTIFVSAGMYGGFGASTHFILLYPSSGKHFEISHTTYID